MKIKEGFILRKICGEYVVVGEGLSQVNFNKMLSLNASAAYLWEQFQGKDFTVEDMAAALMERYEVDKERAYQDSAALAAKWIEEGVLNQ